MSKKRSKSLSQYYTKPHVAKMCVEMLKQQISYELKSFNMLEPSYGKGAFVDAIKQCAYDDYLQQNASNSSHQHDTNNLYYVDIDSNEQEHRCDFLKDFLLPLSDNGLKHWLTIGNPPFGKNSSLAIAFFNKAAEFSSIIAFILPRTFRKQSLIKKLNNNFFMCFEHLLDQNSFIFEGEDYDVPCVFQVWVKNSCISFLKAPPSIPSVGLRLDINRVGNTNADFMYVKNSESPDFAIRRVGVNAGKIFTKDASSKSDQSHIFVRVNDRNNIDAVLNTFQRMGLERFESKYDTAGNPSIGKEEISLLYGKM